MNRIDPGAKWSALGAIGFYFFLLFLLPVTSFWLKQLMNIRLAPDTDLQIAAYMGATMMAGMSLGVALTLLAFKRLLGNFKYVLIAISSVPAALVGGAVLGLIPVAYITTLEPAPPTPD